MSLRSFLGKQFIDVIDWVEPEGGILAYRYPMQDREIQNGGQRTVRDSQLALFVNDEKISGTRDQYMVADLEGQLRETIVGTLSNAFAQSNVPFLDMAANQGQVGQHVAELLKPGFADLGLALDTFVVENLSLPEELQK